MQAGYDDIAVGAAYGSGGAGKVYVYMGSSAGTVSTPAATWSGAVEAYVGSSLVGANLDGDGYADLVVVEPGAGLVTTYAGSAAGLASSGSTVDNGSDDGEFGTNVGAAGDVNADGIDDLLVVAPGYASGTDEGRVYLHSGSARGATAAAASWTGDQRQPERLGYSLSSSGDVNGDGFDDVVVGAPNTGNGDGPPGSMYLYTGSAAGLGAEPAPAWEGSDGSSSYGRNVAILGDVDADGFDDVAVGASGEADGAVDLFYGSAAGLVSSASVLSVGTDCASFGYALAAAGDVNADGYADLVAADPSYDGGAQSAVFVWLGSASGMPGASAASWFGAGGYTPVLGGDGAVDGDAFDEVLIAKVGTSNVLYSGSSTGPSASATQTFPPPGTDSTFAASLILAGDLDNDGYDEMVAGSTTADTIYVYAGSAAGLTYTGTVASPDGAPFGDQLARLDDRDGDGFSELLVAGDGDSTAGVVHVFSGSAAGLVEAPVASLVGDKVGDMFGAALAGGGDVDGDGLADLIVGAWGARPEGGKVQAYGGAWADGDGDGVGLDVDCDDGDASVGAPVPALRGRRWGRLRGGGRGGVPGRGWLRRRPVRLRRHHAGGEPCGRRGLRPARRRLRRPRGRGGGCARDLVRRQRRRWFWQRTGVCL